MEYAPSGFLFIAVKRSLQIICIQYKNVFNTNAENTRDAQGQNGGWNKFTRLDRVDGLP